MKFVQLPAAPLVTPEQAQKLRDKFAAALERSKAEHYWQRVQNLRQPQRRVDWEQLPV